MNLTTLFSAYCKSAEKMNRATMYRGTRFGIAVDSDFYAKEWQRYQRLVDLLEVKLNKALKEIDQQKLHKRERSHGSD
ncbi:unnamed protein product [marine sediment metagenome]|uniref:Uncharacterized protein n=1 Tax=marine sediment metagenome TaxID=412755 RepID=X1IXQ7_9ZZZZ